MVPSISVETPIGWVTLTEAEGEITSLDWRRAPDAPTLLLEEAARQLNAYFAHELQEFDLPLRPRGGSFQQSVNAAMQSIPYGQTREYGEIARDLGAMPQPVGNACGGNSIAIIIPCHRVVGAGGLGGFSAPGGIETKVALLRHEGAYSLLI
ncbi:methylated-DNA--[protein]-cysteine S-methyltransferase [Rhodobacteraceae bacterium NNCM2]|nr:methylated-DNA--[protein]-cysteine S-methyltransferase [Coraliihabitans acroporae]